MARLSGKDKSEKYNSTDYITIEPIEASELQIKDPGQLQCTHYLHQVMKARAAKAIQHVAAYM